MSPKPFDSELISAWLDDQLDADQRAQVESQLAADTELQTLADQLKLQKAECAGLPKYRLDNGFADRLVRSAEVEKAFLSMNAAGVSAAKPEMRRAESRFPLAVAGLASLAAMLAVTLFIMNWPAEPAQVAATKKDGAKSNRAKSAEAEQREENSTQPTPEVGAGGSKRKADHFDYSTDDESQPDSVQFEFKKRGRSNELDSLNLGNQIDREAERQPIESEDASGAESDRPADPVDKSLGLFEPSAETGNPVIPSADAGVEVELKNESGAGRRNNVAGGLAIDQPGSNQSPQPTTIDVRQPVLIEQDAVQHDAVLRIQLAADQSGIDRLGTAIERSGIEPVAPDSSTRQRRGELQGSAPSAGDALDAPTQSVAEEDEITDEIDIARGSLETRQELGYQQGKQTNILGRRFSTDKPTSIVVNASEAQMIQLIEELKSENEVLGLDLSLSRSQEESSALVDSREKAVAGLGGAGGGRGGEPSSPNRRFAPSRDQMPEVATENEPRKELNENRKANQQRPRGKAAGDDTNERLPSDGRATREREAKTVNPQQTLRSMFANDSPEQLRRYLVLIEIKPSEPFPAADANEPPAVPATADPNK